MRVILLLWLFTTGVTCLRGQVGETPRQFEARYGTPKTKGESTYFYEHGGLLITAAFHQGKANFFGMQKGLNDPMMMTFDEIQKSLKANGGSREWKESTGAPAFRAWQTTDGSLIAHYGTQTYNLTIYTQGYEQRERADQAAWAAKHEVR